MVGWLLNWATAPQNVCACLCYWLKFYFSGHVCSNSFSFCLLQISVECKLETCVINQTAWLFPSVARRSLPPSPFHSLITHTFTHNAHPPTGFHSFCFPFDFICCSRSVLIYLCCFTSHSDNLLSCLPAPCLSLLILSNLAPISVFLMASFELRTVVNFYFLCWCM